MMFCQTPDAWKSKDIFKPILETTGQHHSESIHINLAIAKGRDKYIKLDKIMSCKECPFINANDETISRIKSTDSNVCNECNDESSSCLRHQTLNECCGGIDCKPPKVCPAIAGQFSRLCTNSNRLMQFRSRKSKGKVRFLGSLKLSKK